MNEATITPKKSMSWQLWGILLVTLVPIIAAYVAYYTGVGVPEEHVNEGQLLNPAKDVKILLENAEGEKPDFVDNYQWRLLIPITAQCDANCQQNLYVTRQVHIRLGDKADRLQRFAVNLDGDQGEQFLQSIASEHPRLKHFTVTSDAWNQWLQGSNLSADPAREPYYILVDQVGFAMMFYDVQNDGNQLLKDIKRVLRYSPAE